ncbi:MAG: C4-dicarboxylate ABC transporter substrate-binding protein, partial [Opitutae bacterium]|nr:C4-dicarboxylate ABC transporter substrate-binding protein [Opitutae bacterium]
MKHLFSILWLPLALTAGFVVCAKNDTITLRGASQFDENHAFTRTLRKFEELVKTHYGKHVEFEIYLKSELGL